MIRKRARLRDYVATFLILAILLLDACTPEVTAPDAMPELDAAAVDAELDAPPDTGLPSCAAICNPNDGPITCGSSSCTCRNPDGSTNPDGSPMTLECLP